MTLQEQRQPAVKGVDHMAVKVHDLDRAQAFYERVFGPTLWGRTDTLRFLDLGFTDFTLESADDVTPGGGVDHLGCSIASREDIDRWSQWLTQHNVPFRRESRSDAEALWFEDPDGHRFELMWNRPRPSKG